MQHGDNDGVLTSWCAPDDLVAVRGGTVPWREWLACEVKRMARGNKRRLTIASNGRGQLAIVNAAVWRARK